MLASQGTVSLTATPQGLAEALRGRGARRAYLLSRADGEVVSSDSMLGEVRHALFDLADYQGHEGLFFEVGQESGHLLSAFVHSTARGQAAGGVRFWHYGRLLDLVNDGLRLSQGMSQKCALAGLWWGGGKGIVARESDLDYTDDGIRRAVFRDYGLFISGLRGLYYTAEDAGAAPSDIAEIFRCTRYVTCIPPEFGGSGNPSRLTAAGVVVAMEAALHHLDRGDLRGKTVAMQGLGNVSQFMIGDLLQRGVGRVVGTDIDEARVRVLTDRFGGERVELRLVEPDDVGILAESCDVLAPNALGAILDPSTIPRIKAAVVCGAANNQLRDSESDGQRLKDQGVLYVPDFLCNRMGIVSCANEPYGALPDDPAIAAHLSRESTHGVFQRSLDVFRRSERSGRSTAFEARQLADELLSEKNPLWPGRGQQIIDSLVAGDWAAGAP